MALVLVNQGEDIALKALLAHTAGQDQRLKLYQNNVTPAETDTEAGYTEATFTGYSDVAMAGSSWGFTPGAPSEAAFAQQTFTSSADQTSQSIYGYFVTQQTSGLLVWAERFPAGPYAIANNGDNIKVTPKITQD
ncbi:MAG: hypothetical protein KDI55_19985 [Anaerolineae bacterium]|nr:hypothetical protein [Anaerolineae bacterium]